VRQLPIQTGEPNDVVTTSLARGRGTDTSASM
jgi:hypothetical protein